MDIRKPHVFTFTTFIVGLRQRIPSETAGAVEVGFLWKNLRNLLPSHTHLIKVIPQDQRAREPLQQHPVGARRVGGRKRHLGGQRGRDSLHGRFLSPTGAQGVTFCLFTFLGMSTLLKSRTNYIMLILYFVLGCLLLAISLLTLQFI